MAMTEADRFTMHLGLRNTLGDDVADTLMEHLPPHRWGDVARLRDIERVEDTMKEGFQGIEASMRVIVASMIAVSSGIIVMLVQLNQAISGL